MSIILEVWDIYEHNARTINYLLTKNSFYKDSLFFGHQQHSFQIVLYIFDIIFTDSVKLKVMIWE